MRLRAWAERTGATGSARDDAPLGGSMWAGVTDLVRSPYLLGICLFLFGYTLLSTLLYFQQTEFVPAAIKDSAERTRLFALIDVAVNVLALLLQLFAFGAMMEWLGTTFTLAALPAVAIAGFAVLALSPMLATLVVFGVLRRAGEYASRGRRARGQDAGGRPARGGSGLAARSPGCGEHLSRERADLGPLRADVAP